MARAPELESLRLLLEIGATGSIREAAHRRAMSQPAASKRLAQLERNLGVRLVDRTPNGSTLSSGGRAVADWASRVVAELDHLMEGVAAIRAPASADLRVASSLTIAEHLVPEWLSALRRAVRDLHVSLFVTNSQEVQRLVQDGEVDIGLVETILPKGNLKCRVIAHDELTVVVVPGHPWSRLGKPIAAADLASEQLIVREHGSGTRETLDRLLAPYSPVQPCLELGSNAAVRGAVRAGVGPAALSKLAVADELASGRLMAVEVHGIDLHRPLTAVWHRHLNESARTFLECCSVNLSGAGGSVHVESVSSEAHDRLTPSRPPSR